MCFNALKRLACFFCYHPYQDVKEAVKKGDMTAPVMSFDVI